VPFACTANKPLAIKPRSNCAEPCPGPSGYVQERGDDPIWEVLWRVGERNPRGQSDRYRGDRERWPSTRDSARQAANAPEAGPGLNNVHDISTPFRIESLHTAQPARVQTQQTDEAPTREPRAAGSPTGDAGKFQLGAKTACRAWVGRGMSACASRQLNPTLMACLQLSNSHMPSAPVARH